MAKSLHIATEFAQINARDDDAQFARLPTILLHVHLIFTLAIAQALPRVTVFLQINTRDEDLRSSQNLAKLYVLHTAPELGMNDSFLGVGNVFVAKGRDLTLF
ncbi:hypothetical protein PoB_005303200 [Plakobranchus ocellatus]|uniref:Uncharacterized protein n=1 Tax=Plakobranchus ocellatus TaxID=259542 RepID=A0AAV4C582_9GAST|nr:hypothetical protein PoB_005303200 [Plakobranchus ocellatus]